MNIVSRRLASDIDKAIEAKEASKQPHRWHLGASVIGQPCLRKTFYAYRWMYSENFKARMLRLFNRGHREEPVLADLLRGVGATVTLESNGKQLRFSTHNGHFGGSCDGIVKLPDTYGIVGEVLAEFKTSGTGAAFNAVVKEGVVRAKPQHWAQICVYGKMFHVKHYLYIMVNKNDDTLCVEVGEIDLDFGNTLVEKAADLIATEIIPPRLSNDATHWQCKFCAANAVCHRNELPLKNCRSCVNAIPTDDAEWKCRLYDKVIPRKFVETGCDKWDPLR